MGVGVRVEELKPNSCPKIELEFEAPLLYLSLYFPLLPSCPKNHPISSKPQPLQSIQTKFTSNIPILGFKFLLKSKTNKQNAPILLNNYLHLSMCYSNLGCIPFIFLISILFSLSPICVLLPPLPSKPTHTNLSFCKMLFSLCIIEVKHSQNRNFNSTWNKIYVKEKKSIILQLRVKHS